jgi:predicted 3-demethylubiquinone-9 3-methyltransferase (glyoxalase superfamily)
MQKPVTFLLFDGRAEEAINYYMSIFNDSYILQIAHHDSNGFGMAAKIQLATVVLGGQPFMFIDSPVKNDFTFTPAISIYINCDSEEEIDLVYTKLSDSGNIFMPLETYPFSKKFGWLADKFGVSWQLNLFEH